jgi:hypothetical protein
MTTAKMTYAQQLKHPNWQRVRLQMLEAANWKCEECSASEQMLHVHHKRYVKGRMAWEYSHAELQVLCADCHEEHHYIENELNELLAQVSSTESLALLRGFYWKADWFDEWIGDAGRDRDQFTYEVGCVAATLSRMTIGQVFDVLKYAESIAKADSEAKNIARDQIRWLDVTAPTIESMQQEN